MVKVIGALSIKKMTEKMMKKIRDQEQWKTEKKLKQKNNDFSDEEKLCLHPTHSYFNECGNYNDEFCQNNCRFRNKK